MGLLSGLTAAFAYMQVVALSRLGEPETRTVFYFAVGSALAGGAALLLTGISPWPGLAAGLWLLPIGVLAARRAAVHDARLCPCAKTQRGTLVVANLQYSGIVFAAIYSVLLFGDQIAAHRLARHGPDRGQRHRGHRAARPRCPKAPAEEH